MLPDHIQKRFALDLNAVTDNQEASNALQTRADLMIVIRDIVKDHGWKQAEVADKLGLTQPRVSDLINGKIEKFPIELLMTCLFRPGFRFKPNYRTNSSQWQWNSTCN